MVFYAYLCTLKGTLAVPETICTYSNGNVMKYLLGTKRHFQLIPSFRPSPAFFRVGDNIDVCVDLGSLLICDISVQCAGLSSAYVLMVNV